MKDKIDIPDINPDKEAKDANAYWKRRSERKKNIRIKKVKNMKKQFKKVAAAALLLAGATLSLLGKNSYERLKGEEYILSEFASSDDRYNGISVVDFSDGLSIAMTDRVTGKTEYVSLDYAVDYTVKRAENEGMSEAEAYVVVGNSFSARAAKDAFPDLTSEEIEEATMTAYHESQLAKSEGAKRR